MSSVTNTPDSPGKHSTGKLDEVFAAWVVRNFSQNASEDKQRQLKSLAKAVSHALHLKHTCLDLETYKALKDPVLDDLLDGIDSNDIRETNTKAVGVENSDTRPVPLVRSADGQLIWLQKYHHFEREVTRKIARMNPEKLKNQGGSTGVTISDVQLDDLNQLYGNENKDQRDAVKTALSYRFSVITGGPGTGKTYTVARIIALMLKHGVGDQPAPRIALAAPTGKAANRMHQSLMTALTPDDKNSTGNNDTTKLKELTAGHALPDKASTLHSLLKIYRGSPKARRNAADPLPLEVLIVDEASMIDLPTMYRILDAMPKEAHLILLGDKDQLSSVEAGSVLGALCDSDKPYIAKIEKSYRYENSPGIGELAKAINENKPLPYDSEYDHVSWHEQVIQESPWTPEWLEEAEPQIKKLSSYIFKGNKVSDVLEHQADFQILCAFRKGPYGVVGINRMIEKKLGKNTDGWYAGRPVMILTNDHQRKLYNGDVGLVLPVHDVDGEWQIDKNDKNGSNLKACFPMGDNEVKIISLAQMPTFETCYAMTVHKSQGSEYNNVLFVLPADKEDALKNPVLTKELVYTGITRAKHKVDIWCGEGVMEAAVSKKTVRMSGLGKN